ncbi:MAG TPA: FxsA family protein [Epsilonproteobacteria bacterium]|nr:FxsA family protein [Campylobacterota bacterium]HHE06042.1 FxsA family protein [Campylobacterota bacterium]
MIVLLIPFLFIELYLSLKVGEEIGFLGSVIWIVLSFLVGMTLLQKSSYTMMGNVNAMRQGKLDMKKFQNASMSYLAGAVLLIIPGVFSDFLGLLALVYTFYLQFVAKITPEQKNTHFKTQGDDDVIDVEIIDEHGRSDDNT